MTYSVDFRKHVLHVRAKEGLTIIQTAERFQVGTASIVRWLKSPLPRPHPRRKRKLDLLTLAKDVEDNPYSYCFAP